MSWYEKSSWGDREARLSLLRSIRDVGDWLPALTTTGTLFVKKQETWFMRTRYGWNQ